MTTRIGKGSAADAKADVLVLPVFVAEEGASRRTPHRAIDQALGGLIKEVWTAEHFTGAFESTCTLYSGGRIGAGRVLLLGLGKKKELSEESLRRAAAVARKALGKVARVAFDLSGLPASMKTRSAEAITTGVRLAEYRFTAMKSEANAEAPCRLELFTSENEVKEARAGAKRGEAVSLAVGTARELGNLPGNALTPTEMANRARAMARSTGLKATVLTEAKMAELGMGALLGVSRGSEEPAKLIVLEHHGGKKGAAPVVLVGKGLTFDAGGISLKPGADMDKMRYDMCGGAAVIGAMEAVARTGLPLNVVGIVPSSENLPDGKATKPGDVHTAMNGKTIEVLNTDAEGRLILADALTYAQRYKPELIIDLATLTGAVLVALGKSMAGMMGTSEEAMEGLRRAGLDTFERVWQLPLDDEYDALIRGKSADLQNIGGRNAGTVTAAQFLKHFVEETPWVHLDIAGTAWDDTIRPYAKGTGATGFGVRLLLRFLEERAARA